MPSLALTIADVDRTPNAQLTLGVSLSWRLGARGTAKFSVLSVDGLWIPRIGEEVGWFDATGAKIWGGLIHTIRPTALFKQTGEGVPVLTECECVSYEQCLDRRMVTVAVYDSYTCKQIITDIFTSKLIEHGHTDINFPLSVIEDGETLDHYVIEHVRVSDILDDLAARSGYTWWMGRDKELYFVPRATSPATYSAPFSITDAAPNVIRLSLKQSIDGYRNRQHIRVSYQAFGPSEQTIIGDGYTTEWTLYSNDSPAAPSLVNYIESIRVVTGSPASEREASFGIEGTDTDKEFYYEQGGSTLRHDPGSPATPITSDQQVFVTWRHLGGDVMTVENGVEIAARAFIESGSYSDSTGIYEHLIDASSDVDAVGSQSKAQAVLDSRDEIGTEVEGETDEPGLFPGQVLDISVVSPEFIGSVLIDEVNAELLTGDSLRYSFHGSTTAYEDWVAKWNSVLSSGSSTSSVVASSYGSSGSSATLTGNSYTSAWTLAESTTEITSPAGAPAEGDRFSVRIIQDATGGRAITWSEHFASDTQTAIDPTPNSEARFDFVGIGGLWYQVHPFLTVQSA